MESFNISVRDIGINESAVASIANLRKSINESHRVVPHIATRLEKIEDLLATLQALEISDEAVSEGAKDVLRKTGMAGAVNQCGGACDNFSHILKKRTKKTAGDISISERNKDKMWQTEQIKTFQTQVDTCETTVNFAVHSTQLSIQKYTKKGSEEDYERLRQQLQALENETEEQLELTKRQYKEVQLRKKELQQEPEEEEDDDDVAQRTLAIKEVDEQSRLIEAVQVSLGFIYKHINSRRTAQHIGKVTTSDDSKALVGLPVEVIGKVDQRVGDVLTTNNSAAFVGVYDDNVDMRGLFLTKGK